MDAGIQPMGWPARLIGVPMTQLRAGPRARGAIGEPRGAPCDCPAAWFTGGRASTGELLSGGGATAKGPESGQNRSVNIGIGPEVEFVVSSVLSDRADEMDAGSVRSMETRSLPD